MPTCFLTGLCGKAAPTKVKLPIEDPVLAPFVEVRVKNSGGGVDAEANSRGPNDTIRVGNAFPAVVKSFQCGSSNGAGCTIEILDQEGGDFRKIFEKISRGGSSAVYLVEVRFGWISTDCSGSATAALSGSGDPSQQPQGGSASPPLTYVLLNMSINYSHGCLKFTMQCADIINDLYDSRVDKTFGTDKNPITLTDALSQLLKGRSLQVQFVKFTDATSQTTFKFRTDGAGNVDSSKGRKGKYEGLNRSVVDCIVAWCKQSLADDGEAGKGFRYVYDNSTSPPTFYVMASTSPVCEAQFDSARFNVGTYVVNAGNCLSGFTEIHTEDGWQRIDNVVKHQYRGKVACLDDNGQLTWRHIKRWIRSPRNARKLFKLHLHNSRQRLGSISGGIFTEDHPVLTSRGYIPISDLLTSDKINSGTLCPSKEIREAVIGAILGDGYISKKSFTMSIGHSVKQEEYARHKAKLFDLNNIRVNEKTRSIKFTGVASPYWRRLRKAAYKNRKTITEELLKDFSLISLAYLYMDDGHLIQKKKLASIATCCFTKYEVELLSSKIKELGIDSYLRPNDRWPRLYFDKENTRKLSVAIAKYVHPSLNYKLLQEDRNRPKIELQPAMECFFDDFDKIRWEKLEKNSKTVYCLEIEEFNNFITHSGVVHNCSPVISFTPNIKWSGGNAFAAGGTAGGAQPQVVPSKGPAPCLANAQDSPQLYGQPNDPMRVGFAVQQVLSRNEILGGLAAGLRVAYNYMFMHNLANMAWNAIEAELKIQGDPNFSRPILFIGRTINIIVINPFQIVSSCEWQNSQNPCNEILSNVWWIEGVSHDVRDGSFTTTLKVRLPAPGYDISLNAPLGAM